ncbi:hypothetical protein [Pseudomonas meliae]|uniref:Uncharacterized protein n=1 Tax=Pseudomonas meliae TaxID=86176 RepID=A0A0P9UDE9_9PSED|nr:hypothetical protein [Pseudomonas meliae]KPX86321.1 hypothetical protein ALO64_200120 [Pseudomonas meliae]
MKNIYINDVAVGSLSEQEIEEIKTKARAMPKRYMLQVRNLMHGGANVALSSIKSAPVFFLLVLILGFFIGQERVESDIASGGSLAIGSMVGFLIAAAMGSFLVGLIAVVFSLLLFGADYGFRDVAKEEFYRLLRIKLGVSAVGVVTQSDYVVSAE